MEKYRTPPVPSFDRLQPELWLLDPAVAHLNHGSYGAVPRPVLEAQRLAADRVERSPENFYRSELYPEINGVRELVAAFLGADPAGLVLVQNATEAFQVILNSTALTAGSEIVYTDHAYGWVKEAIIRTCADTGAAARQVPFVPGSLPEDVVGAVSDRTALVVLDQITSASALRLPVEEVCALLGERVPVIVDAAHAPGLIGTPVPAGAAYWYGNLHKWAFGPRTTAALVVAPEFRDRVSPLVTSAGAADGFPRSFSYLGTRDLSAYLALPASLSFPVEHLGMTFGELRERNVAVLEAGLERLGLGAETHGLPMTVVPLGRAGGEADARQLASHMRDEGVEVAVTSLAGQLHLRLSVQAYVGLEDFDMLAAALKRLP